MANGGKDEATLSKIIKKSMVVTHKIDLRVDEYNITIKDASDIYKTKSIVETLSKREK